MIKTVAALGVSVIALAAGSASAQDWTGPYFGGFAGAQIQSQEDNERVLFDTNLDGTYGDTVRNTAAADAFSPGFCDGRPNDNNAAAGCSDDDKASGEAGLRAGYDWQVGSFVFGVVGDVSITGVSDSVTAFSITPANYSFRREVQSLASARVRLGYTYGRFLPYVTGGYAMGQVEDTFDSSNTANAFTNGSRSDSADGYQVGAGVETMVTDRISIGAEYMYTDLDYDPLMVRTSQGTAPATNPFLLVNNQGTNQTRSSDSIELHGVRITAAVRF